jgi:mannose-6-phosphate isomerase-like protein (cupin superfamily)
VVVRTPDVAVISEGKQLDIVERGGNAIALAWPGVGSRYRSMHRLELDANGRTARLCHESESAYYVATGSGRVAGKVVKAHDIVYVPRRTPYRFEAEEVLTVVGGPCPPDESLYGGQRREVNRGGDGDVRVYDPEREGVPLPMISKDARLVVWPGSGADVATMNVVRLEPGEENAPHAHAESDDTIAIVSGRGSIDDLTNGVTHEFSVRDVVFVRAGISHKVKANKGVPILSAGGPCPPDYGMLRGLGLV